MKAERAFRLCRRIAPPSVLALALSACGVSGESKGASPGNAGGSSVGSGGGAPAGAGNAGTAPIDTRPTLHLPDAPAPAGRLHKLTATEFANNVHDLLGSDAPLKAVEPDNLTNGFASVGASTVAMSPAGVGLYESSLASATTFAFSDAAHAGKVLSCLPSSATDTACLSKALGAFGRRAFRRPLTDAETSRFVSLATTIAGGAGSSALIGVRHAVSAILQSPNFLYRVELGVPSASDGGRLKYTGWEMASRLAAALWNGAPDDTVLDAAAADTLSTPEGVRTQAQRMIADPRAHRAVQAFVDDLYGVRSLEEASKDPAFFPTFTVSIKEAMRTELEQRVDDMVFTTKGDFLSLYDSRTTFVNKELAAYYGLPTPAGDGFSRVELPADSPRVGLLGAGAILSAFALPQRSSPTTRGKFVTSALLCIEVPPPPPGIPALPAMADASLTMRDRMSAHRNSPACASCHGLMDPIGFGLEHFDAAGMYREKDNGNVLDTTGTLADGAEFDGLAQLATQLRKQPVASACLVSKLYQNALGRPAVSVDKAAIQALAQDFSSNQNRADALLMSIVASEAFRFVEPNKG